MVGGEGVRETEDNNWKHKIQGSGKNSFNFTEKQKTTEITKQNSAYDVMTAISKE